MLLLGRDNLSTPKKETSPVPRGAADITGLFKHLATVLEPTGAASQANPGPYNNRVHSHLDHLLGSSC